MAGRGPGLRRSLPAGLLLLLAAGVAPWLPPPEVHPSGAGLFATGSEASRAQARLEARFKAGELYVLLLEGASEAVGRAATRLGGELVHWPDLTALVRPLEGVSVPGTRSADGRLAALYLFFEREPHGGQARDIVRRLDELEVPPGVRKTVAGTQAEEVALTRVAEEDLLRIVPLVFVALVVVAGWLLGSLAVALLLALVLALVLHLTLVSMNVLYGPLTTVTALVTPIVLAVAAVNALHLVARWREARGTLPVEEALARALCGGHRATLLATATTAAGFLALAAIGIRDFERLAVAGALGCLFTYVVVVVLLPPLLGHLDRGRGKLASPLAWLLARAQRDLALRGRLAHGLLLLLCGLGLGVVALGSRSSWLDQLPEDAPLHRVSRLLDEHLAGSTFLEVLWASPEGLGNEAGLARLRRAATALERGVEGVRAVSSAAGAVDLARALLPGVSAETALALVTGSHPARLPCMLDEGGRHARLTLHLKGRTGEALLAAAQRSREVLQAHTRPGERIDVAGPPLLLAETGARVVLGQARASLLAILLVSLLAAIALRSPHVLPVIAVPNLLPLLALAGVLGWLGVPVSAATAVVGSVVFGLVVDNTIHLLVAQREAGGGREGALRALERLGPAMAAATLLLLVGAAVAGLGRAEPVRLFGRLMGAGVVLALLMDAFLTPRLLARARLERAPGPGHPPAG